MSICDSPSYSNNLSLRCHILKALYRGKKIFWNFPFFFFLFLLWTGVGECKNHNLLSNPHLTFKMLCADLHWSFAMMRNINLIHTVWNLNINVYVICLTILTGSVATRGQLKHCQCQFLTPPKKNNLMRQVYIAHTHTNTHTNTASI